MATSAAYIAGLATDHMVARGNTITGSVGVIFQWAEVSQLLDKIGVKMNEIKSGPLKANPSPFQPVDEAGKAAAEQMVAESQRWFVGLVASRRGIDTASVAGLEQGRVFSGREALAIQADRPDRRRARGRASIWRRSAASRRARRSSTGSPSARADWGVLGIVGRRCRTPVSATAPAAICSARSALSDGARRIAP